MPDIIAVADEADVIINGYAFTRKKNGIHVLNLNNPGRAVVFNAEGEVLETTMDDIELSKQMSPAGCRAHSHGESFFRLLSFSSSADAALGGDGREQGGEDGDDDVADAAQRLLLLLCHGICER